MADPQIDELKELVRQTAKLAQENNRMLRAMRRAGRLKSLVWTSLLLVSIGLSVWSYYTYVAPRVEEIKTVYQKNISPLQSLIQNAQSFFKNPATSTSAQ